MFRTILTLKRFVTLTARARCVPRSKTGAASSHHSKATPHLEPSSVVYKGPLKGGGGRTPTLNNNMIPSLDKATMRQQELSLRMRVPRAAFRVLRVCGAAAFAAAAPLAARPAGRAGFGRAGTLCRQSCRSRSGQVRFVTRPKSRTMRVTRQLMLPPSTVT